MDGLDGPARDEGVPGPRGELSAEPDHLPARLWWLLAALTLAWGFNWTAMKLALAEVPPWTFRSLCLGLGSAVLFAVLRLGGQPIGLRARKHLGQVEGHALALDLDPYADRDRRANRDPRDFAGNES